MPKNIGTYYYKASSHDIACNADQSIVYHVVYSLGIDVAPQRSIHKDRGSPASFLNLRIHAVVTPIEPIKCVYIYKPCALQPAVCICNETMMTNGKLLCHLGAYCFRLRVTIGVTL